MLIWSYSYDPRLGNKVVPFKEFVPEMTYTVSDGTLNSLTHSPTTSLSQQQSGINSASNHVVPISTRLPHTKLSHVH